MIRVARNVIVFTALAVAVHVAVFLRFSEPQGAQSAGSGGADVISLKAAPASYARMVAQWETPPEVAQDAPDMAAPTSPATPSAPPRQPSAETSRPDPPQTAALEPAAPQAPDSPPAPELGAPPPAPAPPVDPELARHKPEPKPTPPKPTPPRPAPKDPSARPARTSSSARAAAPASTAAGSGGGAQAGGARSAKAATLSQTAQTALIAQWGAQVREQIDRAKRAPRDSDTGTVTLLVRIARSGALIGVSVANSSGDAALDRAALEAVSRARAFPKAPDGLTAPQYNFRLPLRFAR
ncbi:energy transducer TonB [Thioclava dalianensis]|uniref:Energy transducer TonB n=1 Tax=Thioclava dalianensis TaxID=1185766 RepID=A0A074TAI4_9RHOB|nr:energy transducer TonB [Thioclava dalianensis]KEP68714.1 energy transducer TonB [Thioclava dalianensis]